MTYTKQIISNVKKNSPVAYWVVIYNIALAVFCIAGLVIEDRTLMGINVWIKPFKFAVSTGIYVLTVAHLSSLYPYSRRKRKFINGAVAWSLLIEMLIIPIQAGRGIRSHFNQETIVDGLMFASMGILISLNVLIMVIFLIDTLRLKLKTPKSIQWAIFMGWAIVLVGSWVGGQMISQMGHAVGVADGGEGIPLLNWSTVAGDLRIAHFFGLHGIQVIPLFAYFIGKKWNTSSRNQIIAVTLFAIAYASWIGMTFYQAKQAMPLIPV